jgi:hypothetical protein
MGGHPARNRMQRCVLIQPGRQLRREVIENGSWRA